MPEKKTVDKAKQALRKGKSPSTAAGEFIREEIERSRDGKHGARTRKQAIAIGLAKARRAGIPLRPQPESPADVRARRAMERAYEAGKKKKQARASASKRTKKVSAPKRKKAKAVASKSALSRRLKAPTPRKSMAPHLSRNARAKLLPA
jgi:hypothetical protein